MSRDQIRRRYLVAYDISHPDRLRRVHKTMKKYGWSMQYSVFISDLDPIEMIDLKRELAEIINHREDTVAFIDAGLPTERTRNSFDFLGVVPSLPSSGPVVI
jgi:CRISPR-associated protein Cas2